MVINQEVFVHNHGQKKQQPTISTFLKKVPAKKGELLLLLPHSVNFNGKINPCGNHSRKQIFLENLEGEYFHHHSKIFLFFAKKMKSNFVEEN